MRVFYFDILRVIGIILVISVHSIGKLDSTYVKAFYASIQSIAVPLFIMVSGALLLKKESSYSTFLKKRLTEIFIPFLFWSVIVFSIKYILKEETSLWNFFPDLFTGKIHPIYWFIYMIFGLYLITPVLSTFVNHTTKVEHSILFLLLFLFLISKNIFTLLAFKLPFSEIHILYFFGGFYLSKYSFPKLEKYSLLIVLILIIIRFLLSINNIIILPYDLYTPVLCFISFLCVKQFETTKRQRIKASITFISQYSFGVYLCHFLFISFFERIGFHAQTFGAVLSTPLLVSASLISSIFLLFLMNKVPYINKVIGVKQ